MPIISGMALTALVVDDEKLSRHYIRAMIAEARPDVDIVEADTAERALSALASGPVDVLFLDIMMPGADGFDLLDRLEHRDFELVFITAYNQFAIQAIKQGAVDYLLKPIKKSDFVAMLNDVLARRAQKLHGAAYVRELEAENERLTHEKASTPGEAESARGLYEGQILTEEDWTAFRTQFNSAHAGFLVRLREKFPGLTGAETRLLALSKLRLTTREMAARLGISPETVRQTRWRLKKKLELPEEQDLDDVVGAI